MMADIGCSITIIELVSNCALSCMYLVTGSGLALDVLGMEFENHRMAGKIPQETPTQKRIS